MVDLVDQPELCGYCGKRFRLAKTLFSHVCEKKRRHLQKTEKRVQTGFLAFNKFFQSTSNSKKNKTYDEFCDSSFYNAFVKFGSFVNNSDAVYPEQFIDYVIRSGIKLDHWCREELYYQYLYEMLKKEPAESAVQRSLITMMNWADICNGDFSNYFEQINLNRAVHDIVEGKISPWIILNCGTGKKLVSTLSDDQLNMISPAFDLQYWQKRFRDKPADVALVKEVCAEAGIK